MSFFVLFEKRSVIYTPSLAKEDASAIAYIGVIPEPPARSPIFVFLVSRILFLNSTIPNPCYLIIPIGPEISRLSPKLIFFSNHDVNLPPFGNSSQGL